VLRKTITLLILLVISAPAIAQIQVAAKGGYHLFWLPSYSEGHTQASYSYPGNSFLIAAVVRQRTAQVFNLGAEVKYLRRSFSVNAGWGGLGGGTDVNYSYSLDQLYLEVQPQFVFGKKFRFFFYPGISFGTLLHSSFYGTSYTWSMSNPPVWRRDTISGSAQDYYPDFEFGLLAGAGIEFPVYQNLSIDIESVFNYSLTRVTKAWGSPGGMMMGVSFEAGIAYTFRSKK